MPERQRVRKELAEDILGHGIHWHYDEAKPEGAQEALDEADARYVAVVEEVNWSRVALEAMTRCVLSEHNNYHSMSPQPCGECIKDELLIEKSWERGRPS